MDDLGLGELSDDQLLELAIVVAREASRRSPAMQAALAESLDHEKAKLEASVRGAARAKEESIKRAEHIANQAMREVEDQKLEQQRRAALIQYFEQVATLIGRHVRELTLVYSPHRGHGRGAGGAALLVNLGSAGELARWHLVDYADSKRHVWTSPGLNDKQPSLISWGQETCAAARALKLTRTMTIVGALL